MRVGSCEFEERAHPADQAARRVPVGMEPVGAPCTARITVNTFHIGTAWFAERAGGLERYYGDLLQHLPQAGVGAQGVVVGSDEVARETGGLVRAFASTETSLPARLWAVRRTTQALLADRSLLVVSHFALYALPVVNQLAHRPLVVHFHGPWAQESAVEGGRPAAVRIKRAIEKAVYLRASLIIALSHAAATMLRDSYGVSPERIRVVPGGVSSSFFISEGKASAREQLGWPGSRPIVLVVRRLTRRMGLEEVIAAGNDIRRRFQDVLLLIAGSGPLSGELRARIIAAGLEEYIRVIGFIPDPLLPFAYRAADITLVPSITLESFGLVAIESLAAGTPVLVTPVGGLPGTVQGLSARCVLPATGARAIADGVIGALEGTLPLPSQEECTRFARERYHWSRVVPRVAAVYAEAIR